MEVHHHPKVEKKNFKEYFLEFIMIFLAVTLGFFAESFREHINNREKEEGYVNSLIANLEQDSADLNSTIKENRYKLKGLDSLLMLANKNLSETANTKLLYENSVHYISFYSAFASNDATMLQLKNAGGFQYITHVHVADSIARYDEAMRGIIAAEQPYAKAINDAMDAMSLLIVFAIRNDTAYYKNNSFTNKQLPLLNYTPNQQQIFFNKISLEHGWTSNYIQNLEERLPFCIRLIALLKKEYDIK